MYIFEYAIVRDFRRPIAILAQKVKQLLTFSWLSLNKKNVSVNLTENLPFIIVFDRNASSLLDNDDPSE